MARSTRGWTSEGPGPRSRRAGGANSPGIAVTCATLHERRAAGENAGGFSGRSCQDAEREVPVTTDQAEVLTVVGEQRGAEAARAERDQDVVQQRRQLRSPALVALFDSVTISRASTHSPTRAGTSPVDAAKATL